MAVVTDVTWIAHVVNALRLLLPGQIRVFRLARRKRRTLGLAQTRGAHAIATCAGAWATGPVLSTSKGSHILEFAPS